MLDLFRYNMSFSDENFLANPNQFFSIFIAFNLCQCKWLREQRIDKLHFLYDFANRNELIELLTIFMSILRALKPTLIHSIRTQGEQSFSTCYEYTFLCIIMKHFHLVWIVIRTVVIM